MTVSFQWAVPKACSVSAWLEGRLGAMGIPGSHANTAVLLTLPQCFGDTLHTHYTPLCPRDSERSLVMPFSGENENISRPLSMLLNF